MWTIWELNLLLFKRTPALCTIHLYQCLHCSTQFRQHPYEKLLIYFNSQGGVVWLLVQYKPSFSCVASIHPSNTCSDKG